MLANTDCCKQFFQEVYVDLYQGKLLHTDATCLESLGMYIPVRWESITMSKNLHSGEECCLAEFLS
jgi:hypothetical protein